MPLTITEALAEIKTIGKRIESKRAAIGPYLARQDGVKDPMEKDGGSEKFISQERQGIADLGARIVTLRRGIQMANDATKVTVGERSRSISEWLTWRREIAPGERTFLQATAQSINSLRDTARRQGVNIIVPGGPAEKTTDLVINISESTLRKEIESLEETLGTLDGQLSLKNATVIIQE